MSEYDPYAALERGLVEQDKEPDHEFVAEMDRPAFRAHIWNLLAMTGVFRTSFDEPGAMAFKEGQRNIGLYYLAKIQRLCPEAYAVMVREQAALKETRDKQQDDANAEP